VSCTSICRILVVTFLVALPKGPVSSQSLDYAELFNEDWKKALSFVSDNETLIKQKLEEYGVSYPVAISVVFPELVRYSALRDKIEITLLKALYINLGAEYANFSIGPFQMKPSFAEMIRKKAWDSMGTKAGKLFVKKTDYDDIRTFRASVVSDLENPEIQVNYIIAFIKICEENFRLKNKSDSDRIRFLATAYNYGFWKKKKEIENMIDKKYFNTTILKTTIYSYSDVSLFWYRHYMHDEKQ
jgi:hypothetical protein